VKHKDAFISAAHGAEPQRSGHRKLTFVCYLNKEWEGGSLRVHVSPEQADILPGADPFIDVEPKFGRVVAFRGSVAIYLVRIEELTH